MSVHEFVKNCRRCKEPFPGSSRYKQCSDCRMIDRMRWHSRKDRSAVVKKQEWIRPEYRNAIAEVLALPRGVQRKLLQFVQG